MSICRSILWLFLCAFVVLPVTTAETFATFPERRELVSPGGRYVLRTIDPNRAPTEFSGTFHILVLEDRSTGETRRLYDYLYKVAVAWSADRIIVTDYVSRKSARTLVFSADSNVDGYIVDKNHLASLVPASQRTRLRENDHVFVEAVRVDGPILVLRVWGYGTRDPGGFRLSCDYRVDQVTASCRDASARRSHP